MGDNISAMTEYIESIIKANDEGSKMLGEMIKETSENNKHSYYDSESGLLVSKLPAGSDAIVFTVGGDHKEKDFRKYVQSVVNNVKNVAKELDVTPIAFSDVLDSHGSNPEMLEIVTEGLIKGANTLGMTCANGEWAILGNVINPEYRANLTLTVLAKRRATREREIDGKIKGISYAIINPEGKLLYMNADGVGTKSLNYLRLLEKVKEEGGDINDILTRVFEDSLAMKLDDLVKHGAVPLIVSDMLETNRHLYESNILLQRAKELGKEQGFIYILQNEYVGERLGSIEGINEGIINVSGSALSAIDPERLKNPLRPKHGDYLIAVKSNGPRSNGISSKRKIMKEVYGSRWHMNPKTPPELIEHMTTPSIIFYATVNKLIEKELISAFYHMSGGAYKGKLAKPLAQEGLHVEMNNIFPPSQADEFFRKQGGKDLQEAYSQWPMGSEGFFATQKPREVLKTLCEEGYEAREVGRLQQENDPEKRGVTLYVPRGENKEIIHFTGK